jgi:hypothetical protein
MLTVHDKHFQQDKHGLGVHVTTPDAVDVRNVSVSDGAVFWQEVNSKPGPVTLANIWNEKATGKYATILWPPGDDHHQICVPKLLWDNTNCQHPIIQSPYEAAFRGKIDDAWIIGVKFKGALDANHNPIKQVVQVRAGKKWLFQQCEFIDSYADLGQQKVATPDGHSHYVNSQQVGTVTFDRCVFHHMNGSLPYSRQPGVAKIECVNCLDASGKKFSKVW